ncbi:MAG: hypothetical protein HKP25_15400 [Marinicaulis sp.]|nr:ribosomal protein L7/L12 [Marinicaulis sp.]NNL90445.1 hypothetical protein [Marinicaulis sp.]
MEHFEPYQIWFLIIAVGYAGFLLGRATANNSDREHRRMLEMETIDGAISKLDVSKREEIMRLVSQKKKIAAIKEMRAESGLGLREAKIAVEQMAAQSGMAGAV